MDTKQENEKLITLKDELQGFVEKINTMSSNCQTNYATNQASRSKTVPTDAQKKASANYQASFPIISQLVTQQATFLVQDINEYLENNPELSPERISKISLFLERTKTLIQNIFNDQMNKVLADSLKPSNGKKLLADYRELFLPRSTKEKQFLGVMAALGSFLGAVAGFFAGLLMGAIIGGGLGSVVPVFGNIGGALLGGIAGASGMAVKGALIGSAAGVAIGATVIGVSAANAQFRRAPVKLNARNMANLLDELIHTKADQLSHLQTKKDLAALEKGKKRSSVVDTVEDVPPVNPPLSEQNKASGCGSPSNTQTLVNPTKIPTPPPRVGSQAAGFYADAKTQVILKHCSKIWHLSEAQPL